MAMPIKRVNRFVNKIADIHYPYCQDSEYDVDLSYKVKSITACLDELNIDFVYDSRYGIIVSNRLNRDVKPYTVNKIVKDKLKNIDLILVSHIDMISVFNNKEVLNKFKDDFSKLDKFEDNISGPLDNTITNAVLLALLALRVENLGDDCKDIMVIFSIGEERKSERGFKEPKGIKNFMEKFSGHLKDDVKFINLDVTANEYHYYKKDQNIAALIEYDESLNSNKIDKLYKYSKLDIFDEIGLGDDIMFCDYSDEEGTSDDLEEIVLYEDVFGFTLGLNTYGTIHSLKNRTTVRNINSYFNQLNKFFDSEFFRPNFR